MPQRAEVIQRYRVVCRQAVLLPDLAKELGLADAVDPQIGLQIGVHFHDLARITRLLDDKVNEERFDVKRRQPTCNCCVFSRLVDQLM